MCSKDNEKLTKVDCEDNVINTSGSTNKHKLLKEAETDDSSGILKYGIDLSDDIEKK